MTKSLFSLFVFMIVLGLSAKSQSVTLGSASDLTIGTNFQISVVTADLPLTSGAQFSISYDPLVVTCTSLSDFHANSIGGYVTGIATPGVISYAFSDGSGKDINGILFKINFSCIGYGSGDLTFENDPTAIAFFDGDVEEYFPTMNDGTIATIAEPLVATYTGTGNWNTHANWDPAYPGPNTDVLINGNVTVGNNGVCKNMTVYPNGAVTINTGVSVVAGGNVVIQSTLAGNGSVIDNGTLTVTGTSTVQQFVRDSYYAGNWHLVSVPVDQVWSYNTFLHFYLKRYNETTGMFVDVQADPGPTGTQLLNVPMEGFSMSFSGVSPDTTLSFIGNLNTGAQSLGYSKNNLGWNLLGNPYPSSIDWDLVGIAGSMSPTVYLYDGTSKNYKWYTTGGPSTTGNQIPPAQGFFIEALSAGSLSFDNTVRVHGTTPFYKGSDEFSNCLKLETSGNSYSDVAFIMFDANATPGFDRGYDVSKLLGFPEVPSIYSFTDDKSYAVNALTSTDDNFLVKAGFKTASNGVYTLNVSGMESFNSNTPILLEDLITNQVTDLRQNPEYSFAYNTNDPIHRFNVHFKNTFGIEDILNGVNIFGGDKEIIVKFAKNNSGTITVTDILGRIISSKTVNGLENVIPVTGGSQYYIVKVSGSSKVITEKVFVR